MRKICVVTGSRAEYGAMKWLLTEIREDPELQLQLIVTGMHLSPEFGLTYRVIEADGFRIDEKIEILLSSDTAIGSAKSIGLGIISFTEALARLKPDLLVLIGDRYELFSVAIPAICHRIPIAHISGGELTGGVIDDVIRHAITKIAHLHFVANEQYRQRIIQMGEQPDSVFTVGEPGLDNLQFLKLLDKPELEKHLDFKITSPLFLVTYHPVTLNPGTAAKDFKELIGALECFPEAKIIITKPNCDMEGRELTGLIDDYSSINAERVKVFTSLGQLLYLSTMKQAVVVIGNSSSGLTEAPALHKPTVNIGDRQKGRLFSESVINCGCSRNEISEGIRRALSPEFQSKLQFNVNPYGLPGASKKIKEILKSITTQSLIHKTFYDILLDEKNVYL